MSVQALAVKMLQRFKMEYHQEKVGIDTYLTHVFDRDVIIKCNINA